MHVMLVSQFVTAACGQQGRIAQFEGNAAALSRKLQLPAFDEVDSTLTCRLRIQQQWIASCLGHGVSG
jgi:hypothetical protein